MRIAIIGGGIAGLTAAYELAKLAREGVPVEAVLYESSNRLGGLIETVREGGFTVECGPDAWVTAKPWARELAAELNLAGELLPSNDAVRKTWILLNNRLVPMPGAMNLMVPTNLDTLEQSALFTPAAIAAYRAEPSRAAELLASIPPNDESVAAFTLRHFGPEVLDRVAAPLLSGVLGGDVHTLSARAVLPALIAAERQHGSLITALQSPRTQLTTENSQLPTIFTTLRTGLGTLIDRLTAAIPAPWLRLNTTVTALEAPSQLTAQSSKLANQTTHPNPARWTLTTSTTNKIHATETFDAVFLATPLDTTRNLLTPLLPQAAQLLPTESSSAVLVAFAFPDATRVPIPPGFGLLVPPTQATSVETELSSRPKSSRSEDAVERPAVAKESSSRPERSTAEKPATPPATESSSRPQRSGVERPPHFAFDPGTNPSSLLLACTFADQKFPHRVPPNGRLLRAFFGGAAADRLTRCNNDEIAAIARLELARILNTNSPLDPTPLPPPVLTVVRRWPRSLPQYAVGHLDRTAALESHLKNLPGLTLLGNALHGVGLPDLIRDARAAARQAAHKK